MFDYVENHSRKKIRNVVHMVWSRNGNDPLTVSTQQPESQSISPPTLARITSASRAEKNMNAEQVLIQWIYLGL